MLVQIELTQEEVKLLLKVMQASLKAQMYSSVSLNAIRQSDLCKLYRKLDPLVTIPARGR